MKKTHKRLLAAAMSAALTVSSAYVAEFSAFAGAGNDYMTTQPEFMQTIYSGLCEGIEEIAAGKRTSSVITIELPEPVSYDFNNESFVNSRLSDALIAEYPYELFWYDYTNEESAKTECSIQVIDGENYVTGVTFSIPFSKAYMGENVFTANPEKIAAAAKAAENAKAIVEENKNKSDYDKLKAYKDKICELVSYDFTVIENPDASLGDPWQLVYVFDNDPATNVVCEGYSKAFQYLCDLSSFNDSSFKCTQVWGNSTDINGSSAHMWNIVTLGGKNYLVDVTNCDEGMIGADDRLFMKGADSADEKGCSFTINLPENLTTKLSYSYFDYTEELYNSALLTVSTEDYLTEEPENSEKTELSGKCGENITWLLSKNEGSETYTLEINGTGSMFSYKTSEIPWIDYNEKITDIVIGADVEGIGAYIFINPFDTPVPANRKIKLIVNEVYSWIVDGSKLTSLTGANFPVLFDAELDVSGLRGKNLMMFFSEDTNLPTSLELSLGEKHAGLFANLFVEIDGEMFFYTNAKIAENGSVVLPNVTAMGNYALMVGEYSDLPGDVNNDGILNAKDSLAILKDYLGLENSPNHDVADINKDGFVNSKDALMVLKIFLGIE